MRMEPTQELTHNLYHRLKSAYRTDRPELQFIIPIYHNYRTKTRKSL
jgi:hypothetical protein